MGVLVKVSLLGRPVALTIFHCRRALFPKRSTRGIKFALERADLFEERFHVRAIAFPRLDEDVVHGCVLRSARALPPL